MITRVGTYKIPTWTGTIVLIVVVNFLIPNTTLLGHLCAAIIGYGFELGYLKFLVPPEKIIRWIEAKLNLLGRLPRYVSVDQKTYGRYGLLDSRDTAEDVRSYRAELYVRLHAEIVTMTKHSKCDRLPLMHDNVADLMTSEGFQ